MLAAVVALFGLQSSPWEREVVYQIFPRSFYDSNGDRIGDLRGIETKLPFLSGLGITTILLNPIAASPNYHNYFSDDFYRIDPEFGTEGDLRNLIRAAHRRKIKVLLDMEPQYVTDRHPWMRALAKDPSAKEKDYVWTKGSWLWGMRLPWYDGVDVRVAAVNPNHPVVRDYVQGAFLKWSRMGIDGYRIDHMMDDLDDKHVKTRLLSRFWRPIFEAVRLRHPDTFFVAEQADWGLGREHFNQGQVDAVYGTVVWDSLRLWSHTKVVKAIDESQSVTPPGRTKLYFIENHDVERFASLVNDDARKMRSAAVLSFALKGTPSIYYGQELGMRGKKGPGPTDGADIPLRLAYEWTRKREGKGMALWYRGTGPWWSEEFARSDDGISWEEQRGRPGSTFEFYRRLISLRRKNPALLEGAQRLLPHSRLVAIERSHKDQRTLVLVNFSEAAQSFDWPATRDLWSAKPLRREALTVPPYGFRIVATGNPRPKA